MGIDPLDIIPVIQYTYDTVMKELDGISPRHVRLSDMKTFFEDSKAFEK